MRRAGAALVVVVLAALWLTIPLGLRVSAQEGADEGPLPRGPNVDLVYANCQVCHNLKYVTDSAGLPPFLWEDTIDLMIQLGMQVSDEERTQLLDYLTTYLGPNPPPEHAEDTGTIATGEPSASAGGDGAPDGAELYAANCSGCHQADGGGVAGVFPPLARHVPALFRAEGGRDYLPLLLLYGLQGRIEVLGESYTNVMPAWAQLGDTELAAILDHLLTAWGNEALLPDGTTPYGVDEVAAARTLELTAHEVFERRPDTGGE